MFSLLKLSSSTMYGWVTSDTKATKPPNVLSKLTTFVLQKAFKGGIKNANHISKMKNSFLSASRNEGLQHWPKF